MTVGITPPRRWDPIVKLTHWGIVLAIITNAVIEEGGSGLHVWVGYGLAGLLALRLLWGFIGPAEARFSAFPPSPAQAVAHIGDIAKGHATPHRSHNPLGALMVYAIWACLAAVIASGIAMAGPPPADPFAQPEREGRAQKIESRYTENEAEEESKAGEEREHHENGEGNEDMMEELHEVAVNLLYVLIALHLAGVIFETRRSGREVIGAMLPGGNRSTR